MTNRTSGTVWSRRQYGACRLALGRPGCEFMKASSSTSRLRRCSIRCRARSDLSTVSIHTLGAAQVHGHGLVTPPVLGAVQWEFLALRTVYEMACFLVSFEGYVLVNMQYKFQQSVQMTVVVPCLQFIDRVGHSCYVFTVQTVQATVEFSRCCSWTGS